MDELNYKEMKSFSRKTNQRDYNRYLQQLINQDVYMGYTKMAPGWEPNELYRFRIVNMDDYDKGRKVKKKSRPYPKFIAMSYVDSEEGVEIDMNEKTLKLYHSATIQ